MKFQRITDDEARRYVAVVTDPDVSAAQEEDEMFRKRDEAETAVASSGLDWDEVDQVVDLADRELAALQLVEATRIRQVRPDRHRTRRAQRRASHDVLRTLPPRLDAPSFGGGEEAA